MLYIIYITFSIDPLFVFLDYLFFFYKISNKLPFYFVVIICVFKCHANIAKGNIGHARKMKWK